MCPRYFHFSSFLRWQMSNCNFSCPCFRLFIEYPCWWLKSNSLYLTRSRSRFCSLTTGCCRLDVAVSLVRPKCLCVSVYMKSGSIALQLLINSKFTLILRNSLELILAVLIRAVCTCIFLPYIYRSCACIWNCVRVYFAAVSIYSARCITIAFIIQIDISNCLKFASLISSRRRRKHWQTNSKNTRISTPLETLAWCSIQVNYSIHSHQCHARVCVSVLFYLSFSCFFSRQIKIHVIQAIQMRAWACFMTNIHSYTHTLSLFSWIDTAAVVIISCSSGLWLLW